MCLMCTLTAKRFAVHVEGIERHTFLFFVPPNIAVSQINTALIQF